MGADYFNTNHDFDDLRDPIVPSCFIFVFNSFTEIYTMSRECITWTDIESYAIMRKVDFTQYEIDLIVKCNNWASEQISRMRKEE